MNFFVLFALITLSQAADGLKIYVFEVGQCDSQLVVFPSGFSMLIDAGEPAGTTTENGVNAKYLAQRIEEILGKKKIDIFVLSHYHIDHMGGYKIGGIWYLLEKKSFTIGKFIRRNPGTYKKSSLSDCKKSAITWKYVGEMTEKTAKFVCYSTATQATTKLSKVSELAHRCNSQQIVPPDTGAEVRVLIRDAFGVKRNNGKPISGNYVSESEPPAENDYSICMRIKWFEFTYSTCGDLSGNRYQGGTGFWYHDVESSVAPMMGEVDLYHVNHHGSKSATNDKWANTLKPTVSIISCGDESTLPHSAPLKRLKNVGSKVFITNNCNPDTVAKYDNIVNFNGDIVVTVSADGKSYTVAKKDGSKAQKFTTKTNKVAPSKCVLLEEQ